MNVVLYRSKNGLTVAERIGLYFVWFEAGMLFL